MGRLTIAQLLDRLTDHDLVLLRSVEQYRLLTTKQIQRLHFDTRHPSPAAAARACTRALSRLRTHGLVIPLQRRIGGVRAGSAGLTWYLGPAGDRLLRTLDHAESQRRRNYGEPSRHFVDHTLAVTELAITTIERVRATPGLEVVSIQTEPTSWQQSLTAHGTASFLKPDLHLILQTPDEELHYFLEADQGTEHLPVIRRQCAAYLTFQATGRYQAEHGLFPAIIWIAPTDQRAAAIRRVADAVTGDDGTDGGLFQTCTSSGYSDHLRAETGDGNQITTTTRKEEPAHDPRTPSGTTPARRR